MTDNTPAEMTIRPARSGVAWVWLVPVLALVVSLGVAWQNYAQRGTLIEIVFQNASGIKAGETALKFRDVDVGTVEAVEFDEGLSDVIISVRVDNKVVPYLDDDAQFWVVQPDVTLRGVTGLETVLSGVFIEGTWDRDPEIAQTTFYGLDGPPLTTIDQLGTAISLRSTDGSVLSSGAPILHKGIQVGYLETPRLSPDGQSVVVDGFVEFPYDRILTTSTRFWDTSGFTVSFGASGVELGVNSIASLIEGGVGFDTVVSGGTPVPSGYTFDVYYDEDTARESVFVEADTPTIEMAVLFDGSVSGLTKGSEVRFQGIRIGQVADLSAVINSDSGVADVQLRALLSLESGRIGMADDTSPEDAIAFIADYVERGLRARLSTANILSGALIVELVEIEDATPEVLDMDTGTYPVIPTTDSAIADVAESAEEVLARINNLPVEELMQGAIDLMASIERLTNDENVRGVPASVTALLDDARALVSSEDLQALPRDLRSTISDLNAIVAQVDDSDVVGKLSNTIDVANSAAVNIDTAVENLPLITSELQKLVKKANALEVEALIAEATRSLDAIDALLTAEGIDALPASLNSSLEEIRMFLAEVRDGGAIGNVNAALASANDAAQAIEQAAQSLPALAERANALVRQTQSVVDSYGERSRFNAETIATLRDIQEAADALSSLARAIQRNPNSLLTGR